LQMMHKDRFLSAGSEDQHLIASRDRLGDCGEKSRIILYMARTDRVGMVVKMRRREMGMHRAGADASQSHRKYLRSQMVDPDDGPPVRLVFFGWICHSEAPLS
jgi:hypothetical protein